MTSPLLQAPTGRGQAMQGPRLAAACQRRAVAALGFRLGAEDLQGELQGLDGPGRQRSKFFWKCDEKKLFWA